MLKKIILLSFFVFQFSLFSEEPAQHLSISPEVGNDFLTPPPAICNPMVSSVFLPQMPKVNVITGEYCEEECDLIVAGSEPLSYRRFYGHQGYKDQAFGHWRINPECQMLFNFELTKDGKRSFQKLVAVGEGDGSFFIYDKIVGNQYLLNPASSKCFIHEETAGRYHPLNTKASFCKTNWGICGNFFYEGTIEDGSGRKRIFKTDAHRWPMDKDKQIGDIRVVPPYQARIEEERLPNGNILCYRYLDYNEPMQHDPWQPNYYILKSITAYNSTRTKLLGSLDIRYFRTGSKTNHRINQIQVAGSDGRKVNLFHRVREIQTMNPKKNRPAAYDVVLERVDSPFKPLKSYNYRWEDRKSYHKAPFLFHAASPEGRLLVTHYDLNSKKVISQTAPIGKQGEFLPIARYEYQNDHTLVYDGEGNKTIYRFNSDKRITAVEKYQTNTLYSTERSVWDAETGNLLKKTLEARSGKPVLMIEYSYDQNQNVIKEVKGDGVNKDCIERTFSNDGFNLKLSESNPSGKKILYSYAPHTNLLLSELVYEDVYLRKRTFHTYDDCAIRIKTIVDDGSSTNPEDLSGVTYRLISVIYPKYSFPCFGLPEIVEERTPDASGKEILLKKVCYTYHPSGKIAQEDHYDANHTFCYSIFHEYDQNERLIATTNPLGHRSTFAYDANFNLVSQSGPCSDFHLEWSYDLLNRPVQKKEWQSDGTILLTQQQYDKANRLIALTDESGFKTLYEYDSLGRLTAIQHPDGSIERKEYDELGNVSLEQDPNGYITRKNYNFRSQPVSIHYPDGSQEFFTYHENQGTLASHVDKNGSTTLYTYDIFNNPIKKEVYSSDGQLIEVTSATYSPFCKLTETDGEGVTTIYSYDFAGRKLSEEKAGKKIFFFYDPLGHLFKTQEEEALWIEEYDFLDRVVEKRTEDCFGTILLQEKYAYDEMGNKIRTIHSQGVFETSYNTRNLPIQKKDPLGNVTLFSYSYSNGFTIRETDPKGIQTFHFKDCTGNEIETLKKNAKHEVIQKVQKRFDRNKNLLEEKHPIFEGNVLITTLTREWEYGPGNRLERVIEAGQKETQYRYDSCGRVATQIKPDGTTLHREYDGLGRLSRYYSQDFDYCYTYDKCSRLLSIKDVFSHEITTRKYDALGNITQEILGTQLMLSHSFDTQGRRILLKLPDQSDIHFTYQGSSLHSISRKEDKTLYLERDLEGHLVKMELPAKLGLVEIQRDACSRWKKISSPYFSADYTDFDPNGNLCGYTYKDALGSFTCTYCYDDLDQLISENAHTYVYDSLYSRRKKDSLLYDINDLCQITSDGQQAYTYDLNGNLIRDGLYSFRYDTQDRLVEIRKGNFQIFHTYDPFHRRLSTVVFQKGKEIDSKLYLWDGDNEIGICDKKHRIQELRILGEGLGAEIGASAFLELNGKTYVPIHDHRGCIVTLVDIKKKIPIETYRYSAYGEELTEGRLSPWRFSSKRVDNETGLIFFGRRYYNPSLGRWVSPDPEGFEHGPNLYAYLQNGPLTDIDPYGLWSAREWFSNAGHYLWGMSEGFGYHLYTIGSTLGMRDLSSTPWQLKSMMPDQAALTSLKGSDWVEKTCIPFTYEARRLGSEVPRQDIFRARGRAFGEMMATLGGVFGARNLVQNGLTSTMQSQNMGRTSLFELSREYLFSGKVAVEKPSQMVKGSRNFLKPDPQAEGAHSVFRRDPMTGKVSHYETYRPQTNRFDPKPWESVKRFDNYRKGAFHFNNVTKERVYTPHVHDPYCPGGIRQPVLWEIPQ